MIPYPSVPLQVSFSWPGAWSEHPDAPGNVGLELPDRHWICVSQGEGCWPRAGVWLRVHAYHGVWRRTCGGSGGCFYSFFRERHDAAPFPAYATWLSQTLQEARSEISTWKADVPPLFPTAQPW